MKESRRLGGGLTDSNILTAVGKNWSKLELFHIYQNCGTMFWTDKFDLQCQRQWGLRFEKLRRHDSARQTLLFVKSKTVSMD